MLIAKSDILLFCGLNKNVEERKLTPWIKEAHRRLRKILGRTLYDLLMAAKGADPNFSLQANERFNSLMAEDEGCGLAYLCWTALALAYPSLHSEADTAGVFAKSGDDHKAVDNATLRTHIARAEAMAGNFQEELLLFLKDNKSLFPELRERVGSEQRIDEQNAQQVTGLGFRKARQQWTYRG
jgi:hypothetical protein